MNGDPSTMLALVSVLNRPLLACEWWNREIQFLSIALGPTEGENNTATVMLPAVCHRLVVVAYAQV